MNHVHEMRKVECAIDALGPASVAAEELSASSMSQ